MSNLWWGYVHNSGTIHLKRYFGPLDIDEAHESPFVKEVYGPWEVASREEAEAKLNEERKCRDEKGL
jgi:hypothetical protein